MGVAPGLEELHDLRLRPAAQPGVGVLAQARRIPAVEQGAGEERRAGFIQGFFVEGQAARRVATAAVAGALDDIGATVPQRVLVGLGCISRRGREHAVPQGDGPAHIQRPRNITGDIRLVGRLYALHEKRVQRFDVVIAEFHVGRVGHGRVQPTTAGCYAMAHCTVKIGQAVSADAGLLVRCDVGGMDRPQRRGHFQATGKRRLARQAVAGHAIAEAGDILATADQGGIEGGFRLFLFERRSRFTGDVPGQQACGDQAGQRQPACGSCESTVVHGRFLKVS